MSLIKKIYYTGKKLKLKTEKIINRKNEEKLQQLNNKLDETDTKLLKEIKKTEYSVDIDKGNLFFDLIKTISLRSDFATAYHSIEYLKKQIELNPDNPESYIEMAKAILSKREFMNKTRYLNYILRITMPVSILASIGIIKGTQLYAKLKKIKDPVEQNLLIAYYLTLKKLKDDKYNPELYHLLGIICKLQNKHKSAVKCFSRAIFLKGDEGKYFFELAECYRELKQNKKAYKSYFIARKLGFKKANARLSRFFKKLLKKEKENLNPEQMEKYKEASEKLYEESPSNYKKLFKVISGVFKMVPLKAKRIRDMIEKIEKYFDKFYFKLNRASK